MSKNILQKIFQDIGVNIVNVFPFLNEEKKEHFEYNILLFSAKIKDEKSFWLYLRKIFKFLNNSHTRLIKPSGKIFRALGFRVMSMKNKLFLCNEKKRLGELIEIDGELAIKKYNRLVRKRYGGTVEYRRHLVLNNLLIGGHKNLELKIKTKESVERLMIKRSRKKLSSGLNVKASIVDCVGVLKIKSLVFDADNVAKIDRIIEKFIKQKVKGVIIDLRGNGGGDSRLAKHLASYFINKRVKFALTKNRIAGSELKFKTNILWVEPNGKKLDWPLVILVNVECCSSTEYFIAGMKDNNRAMILGQRTGGGTGNPVKFSFELNKKKYYYLVSTWMYYRCNGKLVEGRGIFPDVVVEDNILNFEKQDMALNNALDILLAGE